MLSVRVAAHKNSASLPARARLSDMTRIYLSDLTCPPGLEKALTEAGYEVVEEMPPEATGGDDLVLVPLRAGITSSLRHDLNNPLTAVLGYLQLLRKQDDLTEAVAEKIGKIEENARRVGELIRKPDDIA